MDLTTTEMISWYLIFGTAFVIYMWIKFWSLV